MHPNTLFTSLSDGRIDERWVSGTYIVSGVLTIPADRIRENVLRDNLPALFFSLRENRVLKWLILNDNRSDWPNVLALHFKI